MKSPSFVIFKIKIGVKMSTNLSYKDLPVRKDVEKLKILNEKELHDLGKFRWGYSTKINDFKISEEKIGIWFQEYINNHEIHEWFWETDTEEEINRKLKYIKFL